MNSMTLCCKGCPRLVGLHLHDSSPSAPVPTEKLQFVRPGPSHSRLACIFRAAVRLKKHCGICEILHHADSHCVFAASTILTFLKATNTFGSCQRRPTKRMDSLKLTTGPPLLISRFEIVIAKVKRKLLRQIRLLLYKEHTTGKLLGVLFVHLRQKRLDRKAKDVHNALWASCEETSNHNLLHIEGACALCSWQGGTKFFLATPSLHPW